MINALDALLNNKKIAPFEMMTYQLFASSQMGYRWLKEAIEMAFEDCAPPHQMTTEMLAYLEGRRSTLREIKAIIQKIDNLVEVLGNDRPEPEQHIKPSY